MGEYSSSGKLQIITSKTERDMSKKGAFCFRAATKNGAAKGTSPEHNKREKEYMKKMLESEIEREREVVEDIRTELSENNIYYETSPGKKIEEYQKEAENLYRINIGQKPQKGTMFIRPCMLNVNANVTLKQIMEMAEIVKRETGMTLIGAYYHADEGHWHTSNGKRFWVPNYHIHANFLSQHLKDTIEEYDYIDKEGKQKHVKKVVKAGRTCRNMNFSKLQDLLAPVFGMERGEVVNKEVDAFLDPTIKHMRQRSYKAAQIIKAQARIKNLEEKEINALIDYQEAEADVAIIKGELSGLKEEKQEYEVNKTEYDRKKQELKRIKAQIEEQGKEYDSISRQLIHKQQLLSSLDETGLRQYLKELPSRFNAEIERKLHIRGLYPGYSVKSVGEVAGDIAIQIVNAKAESVILKIQPDGKAFINGTQEKKRDGTPQDFSDIAKMFAEINPSAREVFDSIFLRQGHAIADYEHLHVTRMPAQQSHRSNVDASKNKGEIDYGGAKKMGK